MRVRRYPSIPAETILYELASENWQNGKATDRTVTLVVLTESILQLLQSIFAVANQVGLALRVNRHTPYVTALMHDPEPWCFGNQCE